MTNVPHGNTASEISLLRKKKVDFTVYRFGEAAFKLESRAQGHIRKVTQASFKEEIMANDSIELTLQSTERMDFRHRDYIVYDGRPYFLNRLPEVGLDNGRKYTYKIVFEGIMFDLGRVAFVMPDAFGYDYYGTLPEFARLVVDNMNRVNMWVEWDCTIDNVTTHHKGKLCGKQPIDNAVRYQWGRGSSLEYGIDIIYTNGVPSVGDHGYDPELLSPVDYVTVTAVKQWALNFPSKMTNPDVYPTPPQQVPESAYTYQWCSFADAIKENHEALAIAYQKAGSWIYEGYDYEEGVDCAIVDGSISLGVQPAPSRPIPNGIGDTDTVQQSIQFTLQYTKWHEYFNSPDESGVVIESQWTETVLIYRDVTYTAELDSEYNWQVIPVTPQSGSVTSEDYPTESILLNYDQHSCLAVLQDLSNQWEEWEWRILDNTIQYGYVNGETLACGTIVIRKRNEGTRNTHVLGFGRSGGIASLTRKYPDDSNLPSRVYFYGGTQNLPQYYRNTRLCLPNRTKERSYRDFAEITPCPLTIALENMMCEEVVVLDDIYPANEPFVIKDTWADPVIIEETFTSVDGYSRKNHYVQLVIPNGDFFMLTAKWEARSQSLISPNNDYVEWLTLKQYTDSQAARNQYDQYFVGKSKYQTSEKPFFEFQTGDLAGYRLSIHKFEYYDKTEDYLVWLNVVKSSNQDTIDNLNNVPQADYTPNADICCRKGDKFIVTGINMPVAYTYYNGGDQGGNHPHHDFSAEYALWKASTDYMEKRAATIDYNVEVAPSYVASKNEAFRTFDVVQFPDITADGSDITRRVSGVELDLLQGCSYKLTLSNRGVLRPYKVIRNLIKAQNKEER